MHERSELKRMGIWAEMRIVQLIDQFNLREVPVISLKQFLTAIFYSQPTVNFTVRSQCILQAPSTRAGTWPSVVSTVAQNTALIFLPQKFLSEIYKQDYFDLMNQFE